MQQILRGGIYKYDNARAHMANLITNVIDNNNNVIVLDWTGLAVLGTDREYLVELISHMYARQTPPNNV